MLNNFIGGGQVFLHKVRMFGQVFYRTLHVSLFVGVLLAILFNWPIIQKLDWQGFLSYRKSVVALSWDEAMNVMRSNIGKKPDHTTYIDASTGNRKWERIDPIKVKRMSTFQVADKKGFELLTKILLFGFAITASCFGLIFLLWSKFGSGLKDEKKKEGSGVVLTAAEVRRKLRSLGKCSEFYIGKMPLVKDMETRHFLVTGATGSGKTNLLDTLLPQVEKKKHPAVVIDQTGEMIAKYYNKERGDIIFNPFDSRSKGWDFWADCSNREDLERFSKILIGFNRKQSGSHSDPFWENAAQSVFNGCIEYLRPKQASIKEVAHMVCSSQVGYLKTVLAGGEAGRYLSADSKQTAASILSVLASNAKPLTYLCDGEENGSFSMKQHFNDIKNGSPAWLFLATKPKSRALTLPLIACLTELALSELMDIGIDPKRRVWTIIDELPALGLLPALPPLMAEGRKYGACVIAGMQSLNQLYSQYGQYDGSTIFGQFGTSFFFRNTEPAIAKMISSMCGVETVTRQQKNTSFGANEFRDGVSYSEQMQRKQLVEPDDLASLAIGECYTLFSEPDVRLSKMQTPKAHLKDKNPGFVEKQESSGKSYKTLDAKEDLAIENMADNEDVNDTSDSHTGASADVLSRLEIDIQSKNEATDLEK